MKPIATTGVIMALALAGWGGTAMSQGDETVIMRDSMRGPVTQATTLIWDVGNNAMGDDGLIDAAKMDADRWARLAEGALILKEEMRRLGQARTIRAASPEAAADEEPGTFSMADVQRHIDANPGALRELADAMGSYAGNLAAAAQNRDAATAGRLTAELDAACEDCHARYWYPEG